MVKKEDALAEYGTPIHSLFNCKDFSPNDGVNTTHVFGSAANNYDGSGDYFIVTDENNEILSRWFILETNFARNGQWILTLRRDLVVDYYDVIIDAPCFIEKATLTADDPLIFNSENMSVNQIKKKEIPIENNLKTPWVVAYLARKDGEGNYNTFGGQFIYEREPSAPNYALDSIDNYEYSNWLDTSYFICDNFVFKSNYYNEDGTSSSTKVMYMQLGPNGSFTANFTGGRGVESTLPIKRANTKLVCENPTQVYEDIMAVYNTYNETRDGVKYNTLTNIGDADGFAKLSQEAGKTIKIGDTTYEIVADIEVGKYDFPSTSTYITPGTALYNEIFEKLIMPSGLYYEGKTASTYITLPFSLTRITLSLKPLAKSKNVSYGFGFTKAITTDAAYEIIAAPLKQITFNVGGGASITAGGSISLQWFQDLYEKSGGVEGKVYDVQIVPYIPIDTTDVESYQYTTLHSVDNVDEVHGIAFFLPTSSFSNFYQVDVTLNDNVKIGSETELWRITSPNGVGSFDFNPYKNNGWGLVEVDCTLIPINPYIKLNPLFDPEGLYGGDYNDFRGLICGGDFSVSLTSSDWATYQQQNKNFQAVFDRQIQNMEVQNNIARQQEAWGIGAGIGTGAAAGALGGSSFGPIGAVVGAVVGAGASLVGGLKDRELNELLRIEGLDYTKDMFGYTLGNIKARSQTLSKTTSYNINNKYFPYIEYYTCTDREKDALAKKIAWNGMTVMAIGNINDYINNEWSYNDITSKGYIKGRIIRIENLEDEFHLLKEISNEIYKGVYF